MSALISNNRTQVLTSADSLWRAEITATGAALVSLWQGDTELVASPNGQPLYAFAGAVMAPWPNRLEDGRYKFNDVEFLAPINDFQGNNANHGLVFGKDFEIIELAADRLRLRTELFDPSAYQFNVELQVTYELSHGGLHIQLEAINHESSVAPFAIGVHPYFVTDSDSQLEVSAGKFLLKNERGLPIGSTTLSESGVLQHTKNLIADLNIDDCLTELSVNSSDLHETILSRPSLGFEVVLLQSKSLSHLMIFRFDESSESQRTLLALEPQSAPANALRNEPNSHLLEPGQHQTYECSITTRRKA